MSTLVVENLRGAIIGPLSLSVEAGTCAAISGPSGAGKSLLLRMIADLDPNEGEVRLGTIARGAIPAPDWRARVTYLAAEAGWWHERVAPHIPPASHAPARRLAERLGLPSDVLGRMVRTLSTGERQRLALVRALVRSPACLLLDEPTSALDPDAVGEAETLLRETMASGTILVLVTHNATQAARLGTTRYRMSAGTLSRA